MVREYLNHNLSAIIRNFEKQLSEKYDHAIKIDKDTKPILSKLFHAMRTKWQSVKRTEARFLAKFANWLDVSVALPMPAINKEAASKRDHSSSTIPSSDERTKQMKTEDSRSNDSLEVLAQAAQMSLRESETSDESGLLEEATSASSSRAGEDRRTMEPAATRPLSGDETLSFLMEAKLTTDQYLGIRAFIMNHNCQMYPPHRRVLDAKRKCYPPATNKVINETCAEVKLQALLDHTCKRILFTQTDVIKSLAPESVARMSLFCKWGCDETFGQSVYGHGLTDEDSFESGIFVTSLVPMQLLSTDHETKEELVIWKNPRSSSVRCRPVKIQLLREDTEATMGEVSRMEEQIKALNAFDTVIDGKEISVSYKLAQTMIEGKASNAPSSTSSTERCHLCESTLKEFNKIEDILQKKVVEEVRFSISVPHVWIRFFECCVQLSYRLDIKKWQARTKEDKDSVEKRKAIIHEGFDLQLGLILDHPEAEFGNSNDDYAARYFFRKALVSAEITGIDQCIITRFHAILQAISCGHTVDTEKYAKYATHTARKFAELYPWYYMPTTVHELLIHGPQIIGSALLPIGQMSEDAQRSLDKHIERSQEDFPLKDTRIKAMKNVFLRLMIKSDPYISSVPRIRHKKLKKLSLDAQNLLVTSAAEIATEPESSEEEIDESSTDESDSTVAFSE